MYEGFLRKPWVLTFFALKAYDRAHAKYDRIAILRHLSLEGIVFWRNLRPHVGNISH